MTRRIDEPTSLSSRAGDQDAPTNADRPASAPPGALDRQQSNRQQSVDRRAFLRRGSGFAIGALVADALSGNALEFRVARAADEAAKAPNVPPVSIGVIGLGDHGRGLLTALTHVAGANVKVVCDIYDQIHRRALEIAKGATATTEYRKVLDDKSVQAVFIATPSHQHKEIAIAALQAGKHVYCEAPLASTIEDARAIASAAKKHGKQIFQPGLQRRANTLDQSVFGFVKAGVLNQIVAGEGNFSIKNSWRRHGSSKDRERERNWRLFKESSGGLMGEVGIHQIDWTSWYMRGWPTRVRGSGAVLAWQDGREIADTVRCDFEYPGGLVYSYRATLGSSFGGTSDVLQGKMATVLMRGNRAWMIKETDAPALGWEVYATKEPVGDDTGIALVANATKLLDEGKDPSEAKDEYAQGALHYGCETFLEAIRGTLKPTFGAAEGFAATLVALKANEAVLGNKTIEIQKEWFSIS